MIWLVRRSCENGSTTSHHKSLVLFRLTFAIYPYSKSQSMTLSPFFQSA
jgi:hypothetical protein